MNRTYRSIWNEALGAWVAASELSASRGKRSASSAVALVCMLAAFGASTDSRAASSAVPGSATTTGTAGPANVCVSQTPVAVGTTANWTCLGQTAGGGMALITDVSATAATAGTANIDARASAVNAVAIGSLSTTASATNAVAIGAGAQATTINSVALGVNANASNGGLVAIGVGAQSLAQNTIAIGGTASVRLGIAIGFASNSAGNGAVAIGDATTSSAFSTVALGQSAVATNDYAISMGRLANASNVRATALGANSIASGTAATAVGSMATASGNYATATGSRVYFVNGVPREDAYVPGVGFPTATTTQLDTRATGLLSSAYGAAASATANRSLALGALSSATVDGSVALGSDSVSDRAVAGTQGDIPAGSALIHYNTTDRTLLGAVSVGNATSYRQITNVADGTQQQDAVTVRQLSGALQSFAVTPTMYFHANSSAADSLAVGMDAVAIGPQTVVNGNNGIGMGNGATVQASAPGGIAIGQASTSGAADAVALGTQASANAVQGVAIGAGSNVMQVGGVALGAGSVASTAAGVAGYIPPTATAEQRTAIGATTSTLAAVSVGDAANGQYRQITGVAAGTVDSDAVNVSQLKAVQGQVAQIDQGTVKYDVKTDGTTNYNSVTMGGSNSTGAVTVHNVAAGVEGTDAVNVNQLNAGLEGNRQYTDQRFNQLSGDLRKNAKRASAGTAGAIAMANLPQAYLPGKSMVSVGVGGFDGEAGLALGVSKLSDNARWVVKFSATGNSRGKFGVGAGAGFHW
jgi:autotransporter adhesin